MLKKMHLLLLLLLFCFKGVSLSYNFGHQPFVKKREREKQKIFFFSSLLMTPHNYYFISDRQIIAIVAITIIVTKCDINGEGNTMI